MQVSKEVYEQAKAQVLAELKEERRAKQRESERVRTEARAMFDELKSQYMPKLIANAMKVYPNKTDHYWIAKHKFEHVTAMAISTLGELNAKRVYKHGKAEEANRIAKEMLETIVQETKKE